MTISQTEVTPRNLSSARTYMDTLIQMVSEVTLNIQFDATIHIDVITFKPYQFAQHQEYPNK